MTGETQSRRNFLRVLVGGIAAEAAVRTWPFRVFSFPSDIVIPQRGLSMNFLAKHRSGLPDFIIQPIWDYYEVEGKIQRAEI